jgi:hypothetical protein
MKPIVAYLSSILTCLSACWTLTIFNNYYNHYIVRATEFTQAKIFLDSPTCRNNTLRAQLGEFNLCVKAAGIRMMFPIVRALFDTVEELLWWQTSWLDVKIVVSACILCWFLFGVCSYQARREHQYQVMKYYSLPHEHVD